MSPREQLLKTRELRLREKELKLRARELSIRVWEAKFHSKTDVTENGIKGLTVINGGGAVALAAFLQALLLKPEGAPLIPFVVVALALNTFGVAVAASVFWLRYMQNRYENRRNKYTNRNPWWWASWGACLLSIALFMGAMSCVVIGAYTKLQPYVQANQGNR